MSALQPRILVIDNYDSFTYNLVHLLEQLNVPVTVRRNDQFDLYEIDHYSHVLLSPGPGLPAEAGLLMDALRRCDGNASVLGVCLGMQAMLELHGGRIRNLEQVQHGAQDMLECDATAALFRDLPNRLRAGRYHSWGFRPEDLPSEFRITAMSPDGYVMAVQHVGKPLHGVQFHPESIMTEYGLEMVRNWLYSTGST